MTATTTKNPKNLVILGATGTIGTNTLDVIRHLGPSRIRLKGVTAHSRTEELARIAEEFDCDWAAVTDPGKNAALAKSLPSDCRAVQTFDELYDELASPETDSVLCAVLGNSGLRPVLRSLEAGKDVALASKEVLVMAGALVQQCAQRSGARILPVDSEHSAIAQCIEGRRDKPVRRIHLTASGGPFRNTPKSKFASITVQQALRHPTWAMGKKITVDSATLMNKALELIEAYWLFGVDRNKIEVLIHPQSIIHSMVEFMDGNILAQLGAADMRTPIQYALTYPETAETCLPPFDFTKHSELTFEQVDTDRFPAIELARHALAEGGTMPTVLNAANDIAVEAFCREKIRFDSIPDIVQRMMEKHDPINSPSLEDILHIDEEIRRETTELTE